MRDCDRPTGVVSFEHGGGHLPTPKITKTNIFLEQFYVYSNQHSCNTCLGKNKFFMVKGTTHSIIPHAHPQ